MQLFQSLFLGAAALATMVSAQSGNLAFTSVPTSVTAGQPVTVTYSGGTGPVTIRLRRGDPGNLQTVGVLTSTASGGTYSWTPESTLPSGTNYALEISEGSSVNYSGLISLAGSGSPSASSSISASASSSSSSVSSSASSASSAISSIIASVSSSLNASITATTPGSLATGGSTISRNSTMVSPTLTATTTTGTATGATTTGTATGTRAPSANAAAGLASPLALVLGAVAAMIYLN
ncbi:MAG: hypothetical protein M1823_004065 [Watsoniomyces obsoletus]|nr:MAG: hypothetical protein M1823_004065 [Watsoniomyces obsoletus]